MRITRTEQEFNKFNKEISLAQKILNDCKIAKSTPLRKHFLIELGYQLDNISKSIQDIHNLEKVTNIRIASR